MYHLSKFYCCVLQKPTKILRATLEDLASKIQSDFANIEALTAKSSMSLEEVGGHRLVKDIMICGLLRWL